MNTTDYNTNHKTIQVERNSAAWAIVDNVKFFDFLAELNTSTEGYDSVWSHDPISGQISISSQIGVTQSRIYTYENFFIAYNDEMNDFIKKYCEADAALTWTKEQLLIQ